MTGNSSAREGEAMRKDARPVRKAGLFGSTALVPVAAALAGSLMLLAPAQAIAQDSGAGGAGGTGTGSNGGAGGANGGNGGDSVCIANVFPGCVVAAGGVAGSGGSAGSRRGGNGADGQSNTFGGGGGGAGGVGFRFTSVTTSTIATGAAGGNGGNGGTPRSIGAAGGGGGGGGHGLAYLGGSTITISGGTVTGGNGGDGGFGRGVASSGGGGEGGSGLFVIGTGPTSITIASGASVLGGNGGAAGLVQAAGTRGAQGAAGSGIRGADLSITTSGTISGGLLGALAGNGDPVVRGNAITFTGGTNSLTLGTGASFIGNIAVTGTLNLLQNTNATLGTAITGTGVINKTGTGTLSITGDNTNTGSTTIISGALQFGNGGTSGAPGTGAITINSGASLRFNRSDTFTVATAIGGAGDFEMAGSGTLVLTSNSSTTSTAMISAGRLVFGDGGTSGVMIASAITNNAALEYNRSNNISADLIISGTGSVTQSGTGTLTLSGINSYAGGTFLNAGIVRMTNTNSLGANAGAITFNGGTLQFGNAFNLAATRAITINAGGGTIDTNGFVTTLSQAITGVGGLTKTGGSNLLLSGASTYQGGTALQQGSIFVSGTSALGTGTVTLATGTRLGAFNDGTISNAIVMNGPATFEANVGATLTLAGAISGGQAASFNGRVVLAGSNSFSTASISTGSTLIVGNGGTSGSLGLGAVTNSGALILDRSDNFTVSNAITGTGTLRKLGAGTVTLSGNLSLSSLQIDAGELALTGTNTLTGGITVAGGTLRLGSNGAAGGAGGLIRTTGSVIDYADGIDSPTPIALNSNTTQLQVLTGSATQSGVISELDSARPIEKIGAGNLTLTAANTYTGLTRISAGTLTITNGASLGNSTLGAVVASGATLATSGTVLLGSRALTLAGSGVSGNGALQVSGSQLATSGQITLTGDTALTVNSGALFRSTTAGITSAVSAALTINTIGNSSFFADGSVTGIVGLTKTGAGGLFLNGVNTITGAVSLNAGSIELSGGSALGDLAAVTVANGAIFGTANNETIGSLAGAGSVLLRNASTLTVGGNDTSTTYSGPMGGAGGGLTKTGTGTFTLTGANSYSGLTTISGGTLQIGNGGITGSLGGGNIVNNGVLAFNRSDDITLANVINGTGSLLKQGGGVTTLTGLTQASAVRVEAGTLILSRQTFSPIAVTVAGGNLVYTLPAAGGLGGTTVQDGASLILRAPTSSNFTAGTLTLSGTGFGGTGALRNQTPLTATSASAVWDGIVLAGDTLVSAETGVLFLQNVSGAGRTLTVAGDAATLIFGMATGTGGLVKTGAGTLTLLGANTYSGATTINGGKVEIRNNGSLGTGALNINNATLAIGPNVTYTFNGGSLSNARVTGSATLAGLGIFRVATPVTASGGDGFVNGTTGLLGLSFGGGVQFTLFGTNTFTGGISVEGVTSSLRLAAPSAAGGADGTGNAITLSGAVLSLAAGTYGNNIALAGAGSRLDVTGADVATLPGVISQSAGTFGFEKTGTGTLILSGTNTYAGGTTISAGRLQVAGDANLGVATGGITIGDGVLAASGTFNSARNISLTGSGGIEVTLAPTFLTLAGTLSGFGGLAKTGAGTLVLAGNNSYAGTTTVSAGTLSVGNGGVSGSLGTGNVVFNAGSALSFNRSDAYTVANAISGSGSVIKQLAGTLTLSGANSFTGGLTLGGGTVVLGNATAGVIDSAGSGAITTFTGSTILSSVSGALNNRINLGGSNLAFAAASGTTFRLAGQILQGSPIGTTLTFGTGAATGTIELAPAAVTVGATPPAIAVNGGTLRLANDNAFTFVNAGPGITLNGATLGSDLTGSLTRVLTVGAVGGTVDVATGTLTLQSDLTGAGLLTKTGSGELRLAGAVNATGGLRLIAGSLGIVAGNTGGWGSGRLEMATGTSLLIDLPLQVTYANNILLGAGAGSTILSRNTILSGVLSGGTLNIGSLAGSNFLVLSGNSTYGATNIAAGARVQVGLGGTSGTLGTGAVTLGTGSVLSFVRSDDVTVSNVISGSGAIQKQFGNTLNLTGINTAINRFTGTATVNAGTMLVNGVFGDPTGRAATVRVLSGATLGGAGTIAGSVFVSDGGILAPGNSPGTLSILGSLSLADTSVINFELGQAGTVGGANNDLISVGGNLVLDGILNVAALPGFGTGYYRLFNYGGTLTNNLLTLGTLPTGFDGSLRTDIAGQINVLFNNGAQQIQYWDGSDLTGALATVNGEGGSGTWTSTSTNWTTPTGFAINSAWAGQVGVFGGAAGGVVTVAGPQSFQELRFQTNGYTLSPLAAGNGTLVPTGGFSIIDVASGITASIGTQITGASGLAKTGTGTLILSGANNYTGGTTISSGVVEARNLIALGFGPVNIANARLAIAPGVDFNYRGGTFNNAIISGSDTLAGVGIYVVSLPTAVTLPGGLQDGAVGKLGFRASSGTFLTLEGTNTYTGGMRIEFDRTRVRFASPSAAGGVNGLGNAISVSEALVSFGAGTYRNPIDLTFTGIRFEVTGNEVATLAGNISETGTLRGFEKLGTGTLVLSGTNTYTGTTTVTAGTLAVQGGAAIGDVALVTVGAGGTFQLLASERIGGLWGRGRALLGANQLTVGGGVVSSYTGVISGSGGVAVTVGAALSLSGANTYTGLTTVSGQFSTLYVDPTGSLAGSVDIRDRGRLSNQGTINGSVTVEVGAELASFGTIRGNVTGPRVILAGRVMGSVTAGSITPDVALTVDGAVVMTGGGIFGLNNSTVTIGSLAGSGTTSLVADSTLTVGTDNTSTSYTGMIQGLGPVTKVGTGTLNFSGTIDLRRGMIVNGGTLQIASGSTVRQAISTPATLTNNAALINAGTISGLVTNTGSFTSTGVLEAGLTNGTTGNAFVSGRLNGTVINQGNLTLTGITTGIGNVSQSAGTINLGGFNTTIASLAGAGGTVALGGGTLTISGTGLAGTTFDGTITGTGGLIKNGVSTFSLSRAQSYTGPTTINAGTLIIGAAGSLAGTVQNNANFTSNGTIAGLVTNAGALSSTGTLAGGLSNGTVATANIRGVLNGTLTNAGTVSLTGTTTGISTLSQAATGVTNLFGANTSVGSLIGGGAVNLGGATLTVGATNLSGLYSGTIAGSGGLTKVGTGTLTLAGSNTAGSNFTGTANVNAGTLVINGNFGDTAARAATLNLASGATLGGSGTFLGNVSVAAGGILAPGNSPGTLAIGGNLLLNAGSILNFELAQAGVVGGGVNDLITVAGNLTLAGTLNVTALPGFGPGIYRLFNYGGTLTNNGLSFGTMPADYLQNLITDVTGEVSIQFRAPAIVTPDVLYWDGIETGTGPIVINGLGGPGVWNAVTTNWTAAPDFAFNYAWGGNTAVFAGAAGGVVQVSGTQSFQQLRFETGGYTLTAATGGGGLATIGGTSIITVTGGLAARIDTVIEGSAGLSKGGAGTLTLGGANTFTGTTTIGEGTLAIAEGGALAGGVLNSATFTNAGRVTGLVQTLAGGATTNSGTFAAGATNAGTFTNSGTVSGLVQTLAGGATTNSATFNGGATNAGSFTNTGTVSGAVQTLAGGRTTNSGTFSSSATNAGTLTNTGTVSGLAETLAGATTTNTGTFGGGASNAGTLISSGTISGDIGNSAAATLSGRVNGAIANSGTITLAGTLRTSGTLTQTTSGIFDLAGRGAVVGGLAGAGQVRLGSGILTVGDATSTSFGGVISGTGTLNKTGAGTFTLTGANTFTGLTSVDAGGLTLTAGGSLEGGVGNSATFTNAGSVAGLVQTFVGATTTNTGTFGNGATNAGTLTSSGIINGELSNSGRAVLAGRVNGTFVNAATASLSGALTVSGAVTLNTGSTFSLGNFSATIGSLSGTGALQLQTGSLTVGGNNASSLFSGVISGTGSLTKVGTGMLTLTGTNTYTGLTVIDGGTLLIGQAAGGAVPAAAVATATAPVGGGFSLIADADKPAFAAERNSLPGSAILVSGTTVPDSSLSAAPAMAGLGAGDPAASGDVLPSGERLAFIGRPSGGPAVVDALAPGALAPASASGEFLTPAGSPEPHADLGLTRDLGNGAAVVQFDRAIAASDEAPSGEPGSTPAFAAVVDTGGSAVIAPVAPTAFAETLPPSSAVIAGSILNNATLINNGTVLGGLLNSAGASATNNGVIRGAVTNRGTLTSTGTLGGGLDNSGAARISGIVTGAVINSGAITLTGTTTGITGLEQAATGVFDLAGFDTTIGSLSGAGSVLLGNARLTTGTDGVNTLFSGVIAGNGALTKVGSGALILTGTNTYAGGTTISGGILQLGNGGTTGSIAGPVVNNGAFVINRSDAVTFGGVISGSGVFVQAGTGTTTLTGANTYRGGTLISGGRLIGTTTSLQGLIQNDAALEFAQAANGIFAGGIFGTGLLDKTGAGLLELTGDGSGLRGATNVRAGELRVTGSLASSVTTVLSGASLSGNGVVGGLIARSGATVAPGANGLGVLGVNGAVQLQTGSTLQLQVQALQGADAIMSNGAVQIGGTAAFSNLGGVFAFNSRYVLLQTSGTRTGTFDAVTGFADFGILYRPELVYTASQVVLRMAPNLLTNIVGGTPLTPNQRAIVTVIDTAVTAGYNPQPLFNIYALPNAQLPGAFDQLTGEVYATSAGVGIEQERLMREAVLGRTAEVALGSRKAPEMGNGAGAWGQMFAGWGQGDRSANTARYESDRTGLITGIDYGRANDEGSWRIGAYGFYMRNRVTLNARGSRGEIEQAGGGLYAGFNRGGFSAAVGGSLAEVDFDATRTILLPGFAEVNRGRTQGRALQGFGELSYGVTGGKFVYRTFVNIALGSFKLDGLNETGGAAALTVARQDYNTGSVTAGVDGSLQTGRLRLSGMLAGRAQIGDRDPTARVALLAAPGDRLAVNGAQLDDVALSARFDASVAVSKNADVAVGYTGLIGSKTTDHAVRATFSLRF